MTANSGSQNKVATLIDEYGLENLGDELVSAWTAKGEEHQSLRTLADRFNRALLQRRLSEAGLRTVDGEVENMYRLLTDGETTESDRVRLTRRLERQGIDADDLQGQFVSYQTIRRYLTEVRDATYERPTVDRRKRESENLQELRGRVESVTANKLDQLRGSDLTLGEFWTTVDVRVFCESCGGQYDVETLLQRGACDCGDA